MHVYTKNSQIFYEFLFGNPKFFEKPYFSQNYYYILLLPLAFETLKLINNQTTQNFSQLFQQQQNKAIVLTTIHGVSPLKLALNYTLISENQMSPFQILPLTGKYNNFFIQNKKIL